MMNDELHYVLSIMNYELSIMNYELSIMNYELLKPKAIMNDEL